MKGRRQGNGKGHVQPGGHSPRAIRKRIRQLEMDIAANPPRREPIAEYVDQWAPLLGRLTTERKAVQDAEYEALEDAEPAPEPRSFEPGDLVRYTVGMVTAAHGWADPGAAKLNWPRERQYAVRACSCGLCACGRFVRIGEERHIAKAGVERVPLALQRPGASCG